MTNKELLNKLREEILSDIFNILSSILPTNGYAFKGGYILKSVLDGSKKTRGIRATSDIDIDISCDEYFDIIQEKLTPYCEYLKSIRKITSYQFKKPQIKNGRVVSGTIRLYIQPNPNVKKRVLCGVDIGTHPLFYGLITLNNGIIIYSLERMLADKFCAMYLQSEKGLEHRSKDIIDIYLINQYITEQRILLNYSIMLRGISDNLLESIGTRELPSISALERTYLYKKSFLISSVKDTIASDRVAEELLEYKSEEGIIKVAISFINVIRGKYNEKLCR